MACTVMAIGGGKGGTGKSLLAAQLGILLAQQGKRVVLVDADAHGANLHTFFGLEDASTDIDALLSGRCTIQEAILPTGIKRLGLIAGTRQEMAHPTTPEPLHAASSQLRVAEADVVIWDVGSGTSMWSTYLFEQADIGLWVVQSEPTCIEREYHFLRHVCRWRIASLLEPDRLPPMGWLPVPWLASIKRVNAELALSLQEQIRARPFLLLGNLVHAPEDREVAEEMMAACQRFFGIQGQAVGWLPFDERVWLSVRQRRPAVLEFPESRWVEQLQSLAVRLSTYLENVERPHAP